MLSTLSYICVVSEHMESWTLLGVRKTQVTNFRFFKNSTPAQGFITQVSRSRVVMTPVAPCNHTHLRGKSCGRIFDNLKKWRSLDCDRNLPLITVKSQITYVLSG